jgi:hypothetical protein
MMEIFGLSLNIARAEKSTNDHAPVTVTKSSTVKWKLDAVAGNITEAQGRRIAWYILDPQAWSFRSRVEGEQLIRATATRLSSVVGHTVYGRITTRPYPVMSWAERSVVNAPAPTEGFLRITDRDVQAMAGRAQADKMVYLGVDLGSVSKVLSRAGALVPGAVAKDDAQLRQELSEIDATMAQQGIEASPAIGSDMSWLLMRSFALGCPLPAQDVPEMDSYDDMSRFTSGIHWDAEPLADSVRVTCTYGDRTMVRHVVILTVGAMEPLRIPERDTPWMSRTDQLAFPVEWSFRVDVRSAEDVQEEVLSQINRIRHQRDHYVNDHGIDPPRQLARQYARAQEIEDEQRSGTQNLRTRGWYRIAVSAPTEEEALDRARKVRDLYKPQITIERTLDQLALAREFVPGEPLANDAHVRRMPVLTLAGGVPAATAEVGDKRGVHIGYTKGHARRAVMFDPWFGPEVLERSGMALFTGVQGSGKTTLAAGCIYKTAASGVSWNLLDPSGMLTGMTKLAEFKGVSKAISVLNAEPGSFNPYAMVPDPRRSWFTDEEDPELAYMIAIQGAISERRNLTFDTLLACVPPTTLNNFPMISEVIRDAIWMAPAESHSTTERVLEILSQNSEEVARVAYRRLVEAKDGEFSRLFFATEHTGDRGEMETLPRLTVFSLKGLQLPDESAEPDRTRWTNAQLMARPILSLAAHSTLRAMYRLDRHERKGAFLDEVHEIIAAGGSGKQLTLKGSTDTRKHNMAFFMSTQNSSKVLHLANLAGATFCGSTSSDEERSASCELQKLPRGVGYEKRYAELNWRSRRKSDSETGRKEQRPREFIYQDGNGGEGDRGGIETITVDFSPHIEFMKAIDSTADPNKRRDNPDNVVSLNKDEEEAA